MKLVKSLENFCGRKKEKILTIEASGIDNCLGIVSQYFDYVPVVFAKKVESLKIDNDLYGKKVVSYTKNKEYTVRVGKRFLNEGENILIIDDFLAKGCASKGLIELVNIAKCKCLQE